MTLLAIPLPAAHVSHDLVGQFLRDTMGFSGGEVAAVQAGRPIARQMKTRDPVDVNIFGAVRIEAPAETLVRQLHDIDILEHRLGIRQVGKFHDPPQPSDLDGVTLESSDLDALADCRPADCEVQLSAEAIDRFRTHVDWKAADAREQATRLFRQMLFNLLESYRAGGNAALGAYADRARPIPIGPEFGLLASAGDLPVKLPELTRYLVDYPNAALKEATDFFYWNKGEFGMKPTIRLNHVTIYPLTGSGTPEPIRYVVATTQIYSTHYFSATLELRTVVDDPAKPGRGIYLLYTTKSRVSGLTGFMGTLIRSIVRSRARSGMEQYLGLTKKAVEGR